MPNLLRGIYSSVASEDDKENIKILFGGLAYISALDYGEPKKGTPVRVVSSMVSSEPLVDKAMDAIRKTNNTLDRQQAEEELVRAQRVYLSPGRGDTFETMVGKFYDVVSDRIYSKYTAQGIKKEDIDQKLIEAIDTLLRETNDPHIKKVVDGVATNYSDRKSVDLNKQKSQFQINQAATRAQSDVKPNVEVKEAKFIGDFSSTGITVPPITIAGITRSVIDPNAKLVDNYKASAIDSEDRDLAIGIVIPLRKLDPSLPSSDTRGVYVNQLLITGNDEIRGPQEIAQQMLRLSDQSEEVYRQLRQAYTSAGRSSVQLVSDRSELKTKHSDKASVVKAIVNRRLGENRAHIRFFPYRQSILPEKGRSNEVTAGYARYVANSVADAVKVVDNQIVDFQKEYDQYLSEMTRISAGQAALRAGTPTYQIFDKTLGALNPNTGRPVGAMRNATSSELLHSYEEKSRQVREMFQVGVTFDHPEAIDAISDRAFRDIFTGPLFHSPESIAALGSPALRAGMAIATRDPFDPTNVLQSPSVINVINNAILGVGYRKALGAGTPEYGALQNQVNRDVASATINRYVNLKKFIDKNGAASDTKAFEAFLNAYQQEILVHPNLDTNANVTAALRMAMATYATPADVQRAVDSMRDAVGGYDIAAVQVNYHGNKSGILALDVSYKKGMDLSVQNLHLRPTAKTILLKSFLDLKQLETKLDGDLQVISQNLNYYYYTLRGGKPTNSLDNLKPKNWKKGPNWKASIAEQEHGLRLSLLEYFTKKQAHELIEEFIAEADATAGNPAAFQDVLTRFTNRIEDKAKLSKRYEALKYAQAKALAKHAVLKDLVHKYELNPFTFNNIMRAEVVSLIMGQGVMYLNPALFVYGVPAAVGWKLLRPLISFTSLNAIIDQVPFLGANSVWKKRYKELMPNFSDPGKVYDRYFVNVIPGALQRVDASLLDYVKVASHLWTRTEEGSKVVWNLGYSYHYWTQRILSVFEDDAQRFFNSSSFTLRFNDPSKRVSFRDWYRAHFYSTLNRRRRERINGDITSDAISSVIQAGFVGLIEAFRMEITQLFGEGIEASALFPHGLQASIDGMKDFNAQLAKGALSDEGFANYKDMANVTARIAKYVGKFAYGLRGAETFTFEAVKAGIRGGIAGGVAYIFTGGNVNIGLFNFGLHTAGRLIMNFPTNYFIKIEDNGSLSYTNRISRQIHEGKVGVNDPSPIRPNDYRLVNISPVGPIRTFISKWAEAMAPAPSEITVDQYREWARRALPDKVFSDAHGAYKSVGTAGVTKADFRNWLDEKDISGMRRIDHIAASSYAQRGDFGDIGRDAYNHLHQINPATGVPYTPSEFEARFNTWSSLNADPRFYPAGYTNLDALKDDIFSHGTRFADIVAQYPKTAEYLYQQSLGKDMGSWDSTVNANGKTNLDMRKAEWNDMGKSGGFWNRVRDELNLGDHIGATMKGFYHHMPFHVGAGAGMLGKLVRPVLESGMTSITIFSIIGNYNLPLAFWVSSGYFVWDGFGKHLLGNYLRDNTFFGNVMSKYDVVSGHFDKYFLHVEHFIGKGIDILWYTQLSEQMGPIHPLVEGFNNTMTGFGQIGHGLGKLFSGDETGVYDILTGSFTSVTGLFNIAGIGFGIGGIYAAFDGALGALSLIPGIDLAFSGLFLNPIALIATGLVVGFDIFTGGALSRWVMDRVTAAATSVWDWAAPWLGDIFGSNLALTLTIGGFGLLGGVLGAGIWFLLPAVGFAALIPFVIGGAVIGGLLGWAVYTWWPGASGWINGLFNTVTALAGMLSFAISFIFLFRRRNIAEVIIGIFLMGFSLAEVGALLTFPLFTYTNATTGGSSNGVGYGGLGSAACPYQGGTVATCNQGNQNCLILGCNGWSDPGHTYSMATDLGPNGGSHTIVSSFDGTVVKKLYPTDCSWGLGELRIDIDPADLTTGGTGQITGGQSDVAIEYIHLVPSVNVGDIVKKGDVIGQIYPYDPTNPQGCYGGPHLHTTINYYNRQGGDLLREYTYGGVPWGCPAYNSLSVWLANGCVTVAGATPECDAGASLGTTFGCDVAPVNGPLIKTAQNAPSKYPGVGSCPLNADLQTKIQDAATKTGVSPGLLAAEMEYTTNQYGGASLYNNSAITNQQFVTHNVNYIVNQAYDVSRVGPLGIFTDILSNADLKSKLNACIGTSDIGNDTNLSDNLVASGMILNKMMNGGTSLPTTFNACNSSATNTNTATDAQIKSAIQNYVCRGSQSTYPSCGINEANSVDNLTTFFNGSCFGASGPVAGNSKVQ